ncbi:hypothetical protein [Streptomyces sp. 8K308]|uniref:hypothetical protein n=1 Tax=Streptomyces sp. 8K308 TaxID=2530388 RepID=UPI001A9FF56B|nr:hypothetical protein [Streptomyces sp. 8K308]
MKRLQRQVLDPAAEDVLHTLVEQTEDQADDVVAALLAQHRTKGPGVLGAEGPGHIGPFGRWPDIEDGDQDEPDEDEVRWRRARSNVAGCCL